MVSPVRPLAVVRDAVVPRHLATSVRPVGRRVPAPGVLAIHARLGVDRIVVLEIEAPNILANLV